MSTHWSGQREGGGRFALWLIRGIGLHLGRPVARAAVSDHAVLLLAARAGAARCTRVPDSRIRASGTHA
ncbi:MAG: hypothetical protein ACREPN_07260 [Rudaea sp.]